MNCPSCGFNNMPGTERCARCRAQLTVSAPSSVDDFMPPRAGKLKGLRGGGYWYNRIVDLLPNAMPGSLGRFFRGEGTMTSPARAAMVMSVVPGLGHLFSGRRKGAAVAFVVWVAGIALALTFRYGGTRYALVSLIAGWHASVTLDAGRKLDIARKLQDRLRIVLALIVISFVAYFFADRAIGSFYRFAPAPFALKTKGVEQGDILTIEEGPAEWRRGDLVTMYPRGFYVDTGQSYALRGRGRTLSVVMALAGDDVETSSHGVKVNGLRVPAEELPGGGPRFPKTPVGFTVPDGHVFAVTPLGYRGGAGVVDLAAWRGLYTVRISDIIGKATGIYLPWFRRGAFEER